MKINEIKIKHLPDNNVNRNNYMSKIKEEILNNYCFDCHTESPEYISLNYAIFICGICAEYHIKCFKEKNILNNDLNALPIQKLTYLYYGGNKKLKEYIMDECPSLNNLPRYQIYLTNQLAYYRKKLKFLMEGGIEPQKPNFHIMDNFGDNIFSNENTIDSCYNNNNNSSCQNTNYNYINGNNDINNNFRPLNNINNNINILNIYDRNTNNNSFQNYTFNKEKHTNNENNYYYLYSNLNNKNNKCSCIRLSQKLMSRNPNNIYKNKGIISRSCEASPETIRKMNKLAKKNISNSNKSLGIYSKPKLPPFIKSKSKKSHSSAMNSENNHKISSHNDIGFPFPISHNCLIKKNLSEKYISVSKTIDNLKIFKSNTENSINSKYKEIKNNNELFPNNKENNINNKVKINPLKCVKISFPKKSETINKQFQTTTDESYEIRKKKINEQILPLSPQNDRKIKEIIINTKLLSPIKKLRKCSELRNRTFTINNDNSDNKLNVYNNKLIIEQRQPIKINLNLFKINNKKFEESSYNTQNGNDAYFSLCNNNKVNKNGSRNILDIFHPDKINFTNSESNTIKVKISDNDNEITDNFNFNENYKNKNNKECITVDNKNNKLRINKDNTISNNENNHKVNTIKNSKNNIKNKDKDVIKNNNIQNNKDNIKDNDERNNNKDNDRNIKGENNNKITNEDNENKKVKSGKIINVSNLNKDNKNSINSRNTEMKYKKTIFKTRENNKNKINISKKIQKKRENLMKTKGHIMQNKIQKKVLKNRKKKDRIKISKVSPEIIFKSITDLNSPKMKKSIIVNKQLTEITKNISFSVIQNKNKFEIIKGDTIGLQKIKSNDKENKNKVVLKSQKFLDENFSTKNDINKITSDNKITNSCKILLPNKKGCEKIIPRKINFPNLKSNENKVIIENLKKNVENSRNKVIRLGGEENGIINLNNNYYSKKMNGSFITYRSSKCSPNHINNASIRENNANSLNNTKILKHSKIINITEDPLKKYFKKCDVIKIKRNKDNDLSSSNIKFIREDENIEFMRKRKKIILLGKMKQNKSEEKYDNSFGGISKTFYHKYMTKDDEIEDETFKDSIRNRYKRQKIQNTKSKSKTNVLKYLK